MTISEDRAKALEAALGQINKTYGAGSAMVLGESRANETIETIPSGSLAIDLALHTTGYPRGRIIEVYGPEASGKTLLTLTAIARVQAEGGVAAFIDAEYAFDPKWAKKIGVKVEDLVLAQPSNGEEALEIASTLLPLLSLRRSSKVTWVTLRWVLTPV
jgi:recombination protein RecA